LIAVALAGSWPLFINAVVQPNEADISHEKEQVDRSHEAENNISHKT